MNVKLKIQIKFLIKSRVRISISICHARLKNHQIVNIYDKSTESFVQHQIHDFDPNIPHVLSPRSQYANINPTFS